ncbi:MAG: Deoxyribonuclease [Chloroflexi bacterium]|nr:Deoxyribonuclease [Chloroflexota bacterium]
MLIYCDTALAWLPPGLSCAGENHLSKKALLDYQANGVYNEVMRVGKLHDWTVSTSEAIQIQKNLATLIEPSCATLNPRLIAGLDVAITDKNQAKAAVVVLKYPELKLIETAVVEGRVTFPYIPGLLSFREVPLTLQACEKIQLQPDLVFVDGQGIAHPRRMGLASHLGLFLDIPTIGCAKSYLYGDYQPPPKAAASYSYITGSLGEKIGAVVRTKSDVKPLFVSVGHKIDLSSAIHWVLQCCRAHRLPEPTRIAHLVSQGTLVE